MGFTNLYFIFAVLFGDVMINNLRLINRQIDSVILFYQCVLRDSNLLNLKDLILIQFLSNSEK